MISAGECKGSTIGVKYMAWHVFDMSSCRKLEIQNNLPKITKIKWNCGGKTTVVKNP